MGRLVCGCICVLLVICAGMPAAAAPAFADYEKILQVHLHFDNGGYQVLSRQVTYGKSPNLAILSGPLRGVITDGNGMDLEVFFLVEPGTATGDAILQSPADNLVPYTEHHVSGEMYLVLPVFPEMERVSLYDTRTGNLLVSVDAGAAVSTFCQNYPGDPDCVVRGTVPVRTGPVPDMKGLLAVLFLASFIVAAAVFFLMKRTSLPVPVPVQKPVVLIVDDSPDIIAMVSYALSVGGYHCVTASGGRECLDILADLRPDVILLDVVMEPLDGWSTLKQIKKNPDTRKIPVLMLTGNQLTAHDAQQYHICIEDYVRKPFREEDLFAAIDQILARKKSFQDSLAVAEKAGVDREKFCQLVTLTARVSADKKIISILQKPDADLPMSGTADPETRRVISEMIRKTRAQEVQMEELKAQIQLDFAQKGFVPPSW
jgi:two-component system, OmpR family, response regulator